jgi:hypothetical protein
MYLVGPVFLGQPADSLHEVRRSKGVSNDAKVWCASAHLQQAARQGRCSLDGKGFSPPEFRGQTAQDQRGV